ncbi:Na+/H+ antiporter subunit E [Ferrimonas marina]|uniref:Multisubunit sodium/proton antiporter, MrpE subunit n=1 Tax=Ferrimonas marina TaxID=299255 RepID=A0A1M5Z4Z0_9GAMM|nr:Na+/H+ antiporter subunit E [Ferrimonas marina]SHI19279.1 multisubunit sodium/proton antiporter, MrpE subunit [Ferrimonas marina]
MTYFLLNLFLAVAWMLVNGAYSGLDFLIGYGVGYLALALSQPFGLSTSYFKRTQAAVKLLFYFLYLMIVSVMRVVWDVLTPTHLSEPDIVHVPLTASSDLEITLLANLLSLTPGSLSLDVSEDRKYLVIHAMFAADHAEVIDEIKNGLEKKLLEVTRD